MRVSVRVAVIAASVAAFAVLAALLATASSRRPVSAPLVAATPGALRGHATPSLPATIDVVGEVVSHGGATTGTITVRVGATTSQAPTTISPQFLATVHGVRAGDMVTLEVEASGFKYTSLLGTYGKLVRQAGADRVLTVEECDALRVSPLSTALQFFIGRRVGTPASDGQLETAIRSLLGFELVVATSALADLASGAIALPAGYAHGYALLQDQDAYRAFLMQYPELSAGRTAALAALPVTAIDAEEASRTIALVGPVADLSAPLVAPQAQVIERDATGYLVHTPDRRRNSRFTGALDANGALTLTPEGQIYQDTSTFETCVSNGQSVTVRWKLLNESHRVLRKGERTSLRLVLSTFQYSSPNCPEYPTFDSTFANIWAAIDLAQAQPIFRGRRFLGLRALPHFCAPIDTPWLLDVCEYAPHRFNADNNGVALELGAKVDAAMSPTQPVGQSSFTWSVSSPNVMKLDTDLGSTRYWMVDGGNGLVAGLVYVAEANIDGAQQSIAGYASMLNGNVAGGYESLSPIGTWHDSVSDQYLEPYAYDAGTDSVVVGVTRTADGIATRTYHWSHYPELDYQQESRWTVIGGRLFDTRVRGNNARTYRDCDEAMAAGATQCAPARVRYFRPMARSGGVLYGIEEVYTNLGDLVPPFEPSRTVRAAYQSL